MTEKQIKEYRFQSLRKEIKIFATLSNNFDKREYANSIRNKLITISVYDKLFTYDQCIFFENACADFALNWMKINKRTEIISNFMLSWCESISLNDRDIMFSPETVYDTFIRIRDSPSTWGKLLDQESVKSYAAFIAAFPECYGVESLKEFKEVMKKYIDDINIV